MPRQSQPLIFVEMMVPGNFIRYRKSILHYAKGGKGATALLLFHGFGQDYSVFNDWQADLGNEYTLYSFDLFFHGKSEWNAEDAMSKMDWVIFINEFLLQENISGFAIAGYSLGGKFALATLEAFPKEVSKVFLLAPDGVSPSFWYALATWPFITRAFFKSMVARPGRFQDTVQFLKTAGIVHAGILRFAESQMNTEEKRRRVYNTWVNFRNIRSDRAKIITLLNDFNIPLIVLLGSFDKMILPRKIAALLTKVKNRKIEVLATGHNDLISQAVPHLLSTKSEG